MKRTALIILAAVAAISVRADEGGGKAPFFQASLTPDIAIHSRTTRIEGIELSIWGENPESGFAWGFVNGSTGDSSGFSMGLFNYCENYTGVHWGFVNLSKGTFVGWQSAMVNISKEVHGVQTGTVNYTESLHGLQFGLANIVVDNPWFTEFPDKLAKGFVFVNWSF